MIKQHLKILRLLIIAFVLFLPSASFALTDIFVTLKPKNPTPRSPITITLASYSFNVDTALIVWSSGGKEILKGVGEKRVMVYTGDVGTLLPIHVSATIAGNKTFELDTVITPESVDIIYETPESYVPLFYEGLSLPGEGALVKFVALPNISEDGIIISPSSLSYSWYVNGNFMDEHSGIGKQSALINLSLLRNSTTVRVVAHSPKGVVAEKSIEIYPHKVLPLLYLYDDILGPKYDSLLVRRFETTHDFTLALEPFFLSSRNSIGDYSTFSWLMDGFSVTPTGGRLLSLRPKENDYGSKKLSISVSNSKRKLQKAVASLNIIFDTRQ